MEATHVNTVVSIARLNRVRTEQGYVLRLQEFQRRVHDRITQQVQEGATGPQRALWRAQQRRHHAHRPQARRVLLQQL